MKKNKEYMYILYCVHIGILLPNIVWWLWARMGTLVLVLVFAMINNEKELVKTKEDSEDMIVNKNLNN